MKPKYTIKKLTSLPLSVIQPLLKESQKEGYEFIGRLISEYQNGTNRFDRPGEALFGVYSTNSLIAIGGLNQDPYSQQNTTGRVRHLYVLSEWRRKGIGTMLMDRIIEEAKKHFQLLTLRTFNPEADKFYRKIGFATQPSIEYASHHLVLSKLNSAEG